MPEHERSFSDKCARLAHCALAQLPAGKQLIVRWTLRTPSRLPRLLVQAAGDHCAVAVRYHRKMRYKIKRKADSAVSNPADGSDVNGWAQRELARTLGHVRPVDVRNASDPCGVWSDSRTWGRTLALVTRLRPGCG